MDEPPPLPGASRTRSRSPWRIPLIILGGIVGVIALLVSIGVLFSLTAEELPITDSDRAAVVTVAQLAEWFDVADPDPALETWRKVRNLDGSHELNYEFGTEGLFISCSVGVDGSTSDARISFTALSTGVSIGLSMEDMSVDERDDLLEWGDRSKAVILRTGEGDPVGNYFVCQDGKHTILVLFSGVYFDQPEPFRELMAPVLERWERYVP